MTRAQFDAHIARAAELLNCAPEFAPYRMASLSIGMDCSRCGGAGHYSRNAQGSTRCYDCKGAGLVLPTTAKAWTLALAQCADAREDGRLAKYEAYLQASRMTKNAKTVMDAARAESGIHAWVFSSNVSGDEKARRLAVLRHCDGLRLAAENALFKTRELGGAALVDATLAAMAQVGAAVSAYHEATV